MKSLILAASVLSGCFNSGNVTQTTQPTGPADGGAKVSYLCVGMEKSQRFGECPGCEIDAKHLSALMSQIFGYKGDTLISEQATKAAVVSKLKEGIEGTGEDGLFLFFYSGHGGQEYLGGKEPDGKVTTLEASVESHLVALAAEESRKNGGKSIEIAPMRG